MKKIITVSYFTGNLDFEDDYCMNSVIVSDYGVESTGVTWFIKDQECITVPTSSINFISVKKIAVL